LKVTVSPALALNFLEPMTYTVLPFFLNLHLMSNIKDFH